MQAGMDQTIYLCAVWQGASTWLSVFVVAPYSNCLPHHLRSNPSIDIPWFLAPYEGEIINETLTEAQKADGKDFSQRSAMESILGRFGARKQPLKGNLRSLIKGIAEFLLVVQYLPACHLMHSGIPAEHWRFWSSLTTDELYAIYQGMSVSARRIVDSFVKPVYSNPNEERVFNYLLQCMGNLSQEELPRFWGS